MNAATDCITHPTLKTCAPRPHVRHSHKGVNRDYKGTWRAQCWDATAGIRWADSCDTNARDLLRSSDDFSCMTLGGSA